MHKQWWAGMLVALLPWWAAAEAPADLVTDAGKTHRPAILFESTVQKSDKAFIEKARRVAEQARKELGIKFDDYTINEGEDREKKLESIAKTGASMIIA